MKKLKKRLTHYFNNFLILLFILFFINNNISANTIEIKIQGNNFTDTEVIISLLKEFPSEINEESSNYILKTLNNSNLFKDVKIKNLENSYIITITEYPNLNKIYFRKNERLKDEELEIISSELNLKNLNPSSINLFIEEVQKIYESFGYNNSKISFTENIYEDSNTADLYFEFDEGKITKINNIYFSGNNNFANDELKQIINSKIKTLRSIFANNNFKKYEVNRDAFLISNFYKNKGYIDVNVNNTVEYLDTNKVNLYFDIEEGSLYLLSTVDVKDENNLLDKNIFFNINEKINELTNTEQPFSINKINEIKKEISEIIFFNGIEFFEIQSLEKITDNKIDILFNVRSIEPRYAKQINIYGNSRTFDNVIRREIEIAEGDAIHSSQIESIQEKLISLNLFKSVEVNEVEIEDGIINLEIKVEEKQTGTVNAGVSVGTLEGLSVLAGLKERNFYGTGRSLELLLNTSEDKNEFIFSTTDRLSYENDIDISYNANFKQEDFSSSSSYKLDTLSTGVGITYKINKNITHNIDLDYVLKDYSVTNSSTVSDSIGKSSGQNASFLLINNFRYNSLNRGFIPKYGDYLNFNSSIETPTSSSNGFIRNIVTHKKYYNFNKNVISIQTKLGNIFSLNNNDILSDDKFSLGGRWLRGFDNYGAGPRNSRTSYIGGNNLIVSKIDLSRELIKSQDFPIYINVFNDYGLLWDNKTKPTNSDNNIRASAGFGIKYYSPIGPIGFSWGFPLIDEEYDIKRMFLFSVGNID